MTSNESSKELDVFQQIVSGLSSLAEDNRVRVLESAITFLKIDIGHRPFQSSRQAGIQITEVDPLPSPHHATGAGPTPKEFLIEKEPRTDIERVACLAYFLTHYRNAPHFKTLDISKLNTEAAQQKFTNAAQTVKNTCTKGFIVQVARGKKQISAVGEQFVRALPDRETAQLALRTVRKRRARKSSGQSKSTPK